MYSKELIERFWSRVEKTDTCWLWTGCKNKRTGHGMFGVNGRTMGAYRFSLELHLGRPVREGLIAAHAPKICHNPSCVNPAHLREATYRDNLLDRIEDGTHVEIHRFHKAIVTDDQVRAIRKDTRSSRVIAKDYGISHTSVANIKKRSIYASVISHTE